MTDTPKNKIDLAKLKPLPHADGVVGSLDTNAASLLVNQLQQFSLQYAFAT